MENLIIHGSHIVPKVDFNPVSGLLKISGRMVSISSQEYQFFIPVVEWLRLYSENPSHKTRLVVDMEFCSSAGIKNLYQLFRILEEMHGQGKDVSVEWRYAKDDDDAMDKGNYFKQLLSLPFDLVVHSHY